MTKFVKTCSAGQVLNCSFVFSNNSNKQTRIAQFFYIYLFANYVTYFCIVQKRNLRGVSIQVDKLTYSIEDIISGQRFETTLSRLVPESLSEIKKSHWSFDWRLEILTPDREVYKLCRVDEPREIQGLVSLENLNDHIYLHLIESAKANRGKQKKFQGVAGNLFAFACRISLDKGYGGIIAFDSKTTLIDHYQKTLGARILFGRRLVLDPDVAKNLAFQYFGNENED